jgi:3-oxoacyl-[acyl-carrier protein] reductase
MAVNAALRGQTAVVTGAGRGLGRAIALGLAQAGASVWICSRTVTELDATAEQLRRIGGEVHSRPVDIASADACEELVADVLATAGHVDVLVNNAAVLDLLPLAAITPAIWSRAIAVNLTAPYLLTRLVLPGMRQRGGSIVNVSSRAGVMPFANEAAYCAAKFGLEGFTRAVALELTGLPISLNTVTPGLRIKPTSVTDDDVARGGVAGAYEWQDPMLLVDAFLYLAALRGEVTGQRFDAQKLSAVLAAMPEPTVDAVLEMAE